MNDINLINDKNQIDLNSLSIFLLDKEDDYLDVLLQLKEYKEIDYNSDIFFNKILIHFRYEDMKRIPKKLWNDYSFCEKAVRVREYNISYVPFKFRDYNMYKNLYLLNWRIAGRDWFPREHVYQLIKDFPEDTNLKNYILQEYISKEVKKLLKEYYLKEK